MKCTEDFMGPTRAAVVLKRWMRPLCPPQSTPGEARKTLLGNPHLLRIPVDFKHGAAAPQGELRRQVRTRTALAEMEPGFHLEDISPDDVPSEVPRAKPYLPLTSTTPALQQKPADAPPLVPHHLERVRPRQAPLPRMVATWIAAILDAPSGCTGSRAPLHSRDLGSPAASPLGPPVTRSCRSLFPALPISPTCRSTCSSADGVHDSPSGSDEVSILGRLRAYFLETVDAGGTGRVSKTDLFNHIKTLAESESEKLSPDLLELLWEVVRRRYAEIDLGLSGADQDLGVDEWVHFMMLRASAPSHIAMKLINRKLQKTLPQNPGLLASLHSAFEEADIEGNGLLHQDRWPRAFDSVGMKQPSTVIDLDGDGFLDYYEFTCHILGAQTHTVELAMYDLSQGAAKWVPAALLGGHKFEGVWHSGVRVFGKEYWFGGAILESNLDDVPFGVPTRVVQLGTTLRTREELLEFLRNDLYVDYNSKSYDVLRRNCNHFANEIVQFMLHGKQIPEEVLMQPQWARTASLVRALRPALNRWLGGFGDEVACSPTASPTSPSTPRVVSRIDDMTQEWRNRLQVGDIVLHRARFIDRPWVVRIVGLTHTKNHRTAEIVYFHPTGTRWEDVPSMLSLGGQWKWEVVQQPSVSLHEFFPLLDEAEAGAQILKAGLTLGDARAVGVLQREPPAPFRPSCPRGHWLQLAGAPSWFCKVPPCTVCGQHVASKEHHSCTRCHVVICGTCFARGSTFGGGGVFADILTPELAHELLADAGWLKYRARAYFFKADHNGTGMIDKSKARRVNERLAAELNAKPLSDLALVQDMRKASAHRRHPLEHANAAVATHSSGKELRKASLLLDEVSFEDFFCITLSRMLDRCVSDRRRDQ